jgi:multidrug efflux system membrane fusion protein
VSRRLPIVLLAAALAAAGCGKARAPGAPPVPVSVARAELRDVPYEIPGTGTAEPLQTVSVQSQVTGLLTRVAFHEGAEVAEGEALFQIDPRPFRAALDQAAANLARDRAQMENAVQEAERYADLVKKDYVTQADYDARRSAAEASRASFHADSAAVENARLNLEYTTIRAPISGRTGNLLVHEGNLVRANAPEPLVVINRIRPILVRFTVPERHLALLQRYRSGRLPVYVVPGGSDSTTHEGRLTFIDNNVDPGTGTILLKAEFPNADRSLWPGEFVNARLVLFTERRACVVPSQAVSQGQEGAYVYVVQPDRTAALKPVTVARATEEWAVIARGVAPGDQVVTDGQLRLAPGSKVVVKGAGTAGEGAGTAGGSAGGGPGPAARGGGGGKGSAKGS